jgi:signal transduction histidine kinase
LARIGDAARSDVLLPALATEVADMLRGLQKYRDRRLVMRLSRSSSLLVRGNADELKQVILNLLVNALEVVDPARGEVVVSASRHNGSVRLMVEDNGIGMTPDVLNHVFEPFYSARGSVGARGTGLGLSISHSIVESHGGTLRAESDGPGTGSRFIIELPLASESVPHGR